MKKVTLFILLLISGSLFLKAQSYSGGAGIEGNPFQIATKADLKYLSDNDTHYDGYYFIQTADIYFEASDFQSGGDFYYGGEGFLPIGGGSGTNMRRFRSSYDGNNKVIDGIYMNRSEDDAGFFGEIEQLVQWSPNYAVLHTPTIENVTLTNVNITNSGSLTGGLVGQTFNGVTLSNCAVSGSVTGYQTGGLTGQSESFTTVSNSRSSASVSGTYIVGGLIGWAYGDVNKCYSTGDVSGQGNVGGFVGIVGEDAEITDCYSKGDVNRTSGATGTTIGGFTGVVAYDEMMGGAGIVHHCYSLGSVNYINASNPTDKGFSGSFTGNFSSNYFDGDVSNQSSAAGATAKTTAQMKTQSTFVYWNFTTIWEIIGGDGANYPTLRDNPEPSEVTTPTTQASAILFSDVQTTQMTVGWTNGDGTDRVVFAKQANTGTTSPVDNTTYIANTAFGSGTQIATGWFCVYNGSGTSVTVTNLSHSTDYIFQVFEYNGGAGEEHYLTSTATDNPNSETTATITLTWTGTTDTDWNTATNWSTGTVPAASHNIIIPDVANDPVIVDGLSAYTALGASLTVEENATLTITDNTTLDLSGDLTNNGTINVNGNTGTYAYLDVDGTFDNNGSLSINLYGDVDAFGDFDGTGGSISFTSGNAMYPGYLRMGAAVTSFGTMTYTMGTVIYNGSVAQTVIADDYYNLQMAGNSTKTIGGNINVAASFTCADANTIINLGSYTLSASGFSVTAGTFNGNTGTVIASGLTNLTGYVAGTSTFRYTGTSGQGVGGNGVDFYDLELYPCSGSYRQIYYDLAVSNDLTQSADAELRLYDYYGSSHNLTVGGTITNNGSIKMKSGGSVLDGGIAGSGSWEIPRVISEETWHLISSPVAAANSGIFEGDYLQYWTENGQTWNDITSMTDALTPGQGYGLWATPGKTTHTYTFNGTPNTGNVVKGITYTNTGGDSYDGANLLGNPYPSSIDWTQVSGYGAVYYWNGSAYVAYPEGTGSYGTGSQYVPPMQGFFIVVPDNDPSTFTFTNAMRTHSGATYYYKSEKALPDGLMLYADNGSYQDKLLLRINADATALMDQDRDAWKFPSNTPGLAQLWSVCPDGNLSIDVRPYQESIPLGFANDQAGFYTIGISEIADISTAILEDTKEDLFHDLTKGAYGFAWDLADDEGRFILHLGPTGVDDTPQLNNNLLIYAHNGALHLKALNGAQSGTLSITDMAGRMLYQSKLTIDGETIVNPGIPAGAYVIRFASENKVITKKVIIN